MKIAITKKVQFHTFTVTITYICRDGVYTLIAETSIDKQVWELPNILPGEVWEIDSNYGRSVISLFREVEKTHGANFENENWKLVFGQKSWISDSPNQNPSPVSYQPLNPKTENFFSQIYSKLRNGQ